VLNFVIGNMSNVEDVPDEDEESVIPSTKRTRRSLAWDYFEKYFDERRLPRARCLKCGTSYVAKEDSRTKNMLKHMLKCVEGMDISSYLPLNQEKYREKIAQVIVKNNYSFSFVEHDRIH